MRKCRGQYYAGVNNWSQFELGYFHGWGCNYEEFESGPGNYSVAIVELPDGRIVLPLADNIQFLDKPEERA